MKTKVGFIGFGLIAGALAHALKESGRDYHITATSRHLEPVIAAVADGIVDVAAPAVDETFAQCDIILLCTPVITITEYLTKLKAIASPDCIITDVGSVKTIIHEAADSLGLNDRFIGGHPMAGSEKTGYENSSSSIIKGARYIITPTKETKPEKIEFMKQFASDVGMNPIVMDYHVHDKSVAAISHVPHLLSTALVHVVSDNDDEEKLQEKGGVSALDSTLFAILKDLRKKIAKTNNLPPYVIFQDPSLEDMCTNYPITIEELANIQGVGAGKAQKYGKEFIEVIKQYVEDNEIERAQDMVVKTVANKSKFKVYIIQNIDRKIDLEDIASALSLSFDELIKEMEAIVFSGTKLNIDYYLNQILDEEQQEEIMDYFMEASSDNISEAFDEFEGDYAEEDLRLMRLKLHSKHGN